MGIKNLLSQKISYKRYDAGKVAKSISQARKSGATKKYKEAIATGYRVLGKSRTKPSKVLNNAPKYKMPKTPSNGRGIGM